MNILQVCSAREIGGGERHLVDLSRSLAERGHTVYVALSPGSPLISELSFLPTHQILEVSLRNSLDLSSAMQLARFAREHSVDIIHSHVARDYPLTAFASARAGNIPYVLTRHVLFPLKRAHRLILSRASRVIAVSRAVAAALHRQGIFDQNKIVTIPNGINIERFAEKARYQTRALYPDKDVSKLIVGMVGHLAPIKGQQDLIRAAAILAAERNDVDFVIAGEDKSHTGEHRAAIESLIAELKLTKRIQLLGWIDDVRELLGSLDVFVSPSRAEPFGLVIVEAMASGVPVVATMSEGATEITEDGVTGRLVPIKDPEALAIAIKELLADPSERKRFSVNARNRVEQYSLERMVDATEQVYLDVLKTTDGDPDHGISEHREE
ncbi:MAG TPA: glycosyltransferase family 4 protein [Pyrinomonadaceae bacterium]|nr:glycosyltransferase family 4 protein [Pyrinomonadaceae bacterium]